MLTMKHNDQLGRHLDICRQIYKRLRREGKWPWSDSTESEDLIESESDKNRV